MNAVMNLGVLYNAEISCCHIYDKKIIIIATFVSGEGA